MHTQLYLSYNYAVRYTKRGHRLYVHYIHTYITCVRIQSLHVHLYKYIICVHTRLLHVNAHYICIYTYTYTLCTRTRTLYVCSCKCTYSLTFLTYSQPVSQTEIFFGLRLTKSVVDKSFIGKPQSHAFLQNCQQK